jgi:hypothetical protein
VGRSGNQQVPQSSGGTSDLFDQCAKPKAIMETGFALPTVEALLEDPYFEQNPNAKVLAEAGTYGTPAFWCSARTSRTT